MSPISPGKIIGMKTLPSACADLSFETDGIVADGSGVYGQTVTPFNFDTFYSNLRLTVPGNSARLKYDSLGISRDPLVMASALFFLRAEHRKALLDKAVASRENVFYKRYANQTVP
jgi:hypothetical protein